MSEATSDELGRVKRERDLYRALLELGGQERLEPLLEHALALVVASPAPRRATSRCATRAARTNAATWWMGHACSPAEVDEIRATVSRGIIAEALASGRTILTHSALARRALPQPRERARAPDRGGDLRADRRRRLARRRLPPGPRRAGRVHATRRASTPRRWRSTWRRSSSACSRARAARGAATPRSALRARYRIDDVVGRGPAIAQALEQAMLAAPLDVSVLLTGPSGSGKSLLARAIHANSRRASAPFVELNCAALPENLIESELFGALAGSHSEARRNLPGKVAAAEGGTLFLDEIGEIPYAAQAKLLQLLQSKQYYPLGSPQPVQADVRLVAATNEDLREAVKARRFREDLFYRLQVLPIRMPALAERREDLPDLAAAPARRGLPPPRPPAAAPRRARACARSRPASGRATCASSSTPSRPPPSAPPARASRPIEPRHLFPAAARPSDAAGELNFRDATRWFQRELLERTLRESEWNVAEVARRLGLARSHVYNLIRAFELGRADEGT